MKFPSYIVAVSLLMSSTLFGQTGTVQRSQNKTIEQQFNKPPRDARPMVYWMWLETKPTHRELTRDLEQMKDKGIVGAIIYTTGAGRVSATNFKMVLKDKRYRRVRTNDYKGATSSVIPGTKMLAWSPDWMDAVAFSAKEANRLGFDLGVCEGPVGADVPRGAISAADGEKQLEWSQQSFSGPGTYNGTLPEPWSTNPARKSKRQISEPYHQDIAVIAVPNKSIINVHDVLNLTSKMDSQGHIQWNAPAGKWII